MRAITPKTTLAKTTLQLTWGGFLTNKRYQLLILADIPGSNRPMPELIKLYGSAQTGVKKRPAVFVTFR